MYSTSLLCTFVSDIDVRNGCFLSPEGWDKNAEVVDTTLTILNRTAFTVSILNKSKVRKMLIISDNFFRYMV